MKDINDENVEIYQVSDREMVENEQEETAESVSKDIQEDKDDENITLALEKDDATVARRLHEISAKKNEWKRRAEEYKRKLDELEVKMQKEEPKKVAVDEGMEKIFKEDVMAIKRAFPYVKINDVREIPELKTFAKLRDAGLDAVAAYRAISSEEIIKRAIAERSEAGDNRAHLTAIGGQNKGRSLDAIPADMLPIWKSAFPKLSESQLTVLYNKNK